MSKNIEAFFAAVDEVLTEQPTLAQIEDHKRLLEADVQTQLQELVNNGEWTETQAFDYFERYRQTLWPSS